MKIITPFVSVIIPNYCHARYLDQRIQSVLNQTYQNFEVIILDDCSPDNGASRAVIEKYRSNPHVSHIVYNEKNSGSTFIQWEKGFNLACGEYIWIAESDDFCTNDHLQTLVKEVEVNKNISVAFCQSQYVDANGDLIAPIYPQDKKVEKFIGLQFIRKHMLYGNAIWNASSAIFKRSNALSIDHQYMGFVSAGDRLFWIEMAEKGDVIFSHSPQNFFRQHDNKVTPIKQLKGITSREDYKIVRYIEKKGFVSFIESLFVRETYMKDISNKTLENEEIRISLLKLWKKYNIFDIGLIQIFCKIHFKIMKIWERIV